MRPENRCFLRGVSFFLSLRVNGCCDASLRVILLRESRLPINVAFIFYPFPLYKSISLSILHTLGCVAVFFKQVDYSALACIVCRTNNIEHVLAL